MGRNTYNLKKAKLMVMQIVPFVLLIGVVIGGFYAGIALNWWEDPFAATPTPTPTTLDSDEIAITTLWWGTNDEIDIDDCDIGVYRYGTEGKTATAIANRDYADYSLYTTIDSGYKLTLDEELYKYYFNISGIDICTRYFALEDLIVGEINIVYMMNFTEDETILCYSTDEMSVTVADSPYDKWTIETRNLDGAEGVGEITDDEGWMYPFYPSGTDSIFAGLEEYVVIIIDTNVTTTAATYCKYTGYDASLVTESVSGAYIYYEIPRILWGTQTFNIQFNADLIHSTFDLDDISIAYGTADSNTVWDVQV